MFFSYFVIVVLVIEYFYLKFMMIMVGDDIVVVGESEEVKNVWFEVEKKVRFCYEKLSVFEDIVVNCVFVNGILLYLFVYEILNSIVVFLNCRD